MNTQTGLKADTMRCRILTCFRSTLAFASRSIGSSDMHEAFASMSTRTVPNSRIVRGEVDRAWSCTIGIASVA